MNQLETMDLTEYVFLKIKEFCDFADCDFGYTHSHFIIGRIKTMYELRSIIELLQIQNKYEVFIETERVQDEIMYSIAGCRIKEMDGI